MPLREHVFLLTQIGIDALLREDIVRNQVFGIHDQSTVTSDSALAYTALTLVGLALCVPYWRALGLI